MSLKNQLLEIVEQIQELTTPDAQDYFETNPAAVDTLERKCLAFYEALEQAQGDIEDARCGDCGEILCVCEDSESEEEEE